MSLEGFPMYMHYGHVLWSGLQYGIYVPWVTAMYFLDQYNTYTLHMYLYISSLLTDFVSGESAPHTVPLNNTEQC